jgi:sugar phosphate isomerase/epimerase
MWKLALHSVSYAGVWPGQEALPLEDFIEHAADLGYAGVMLMAKRGHASLLDLGAERRCAVRERLQRRGLALAGIAAYTDFTAGAERPDIPLLEMQVLYVRECARLARDLGGSIVRIFTGYERPELSPGQSWSRCVQAVKECARAAADVGVTLAVQNHHDIANHYEALADFLSEVDEPNVGAGYDAWAPTMQGLPSEQIAAAVRALGPSIVQTIVADYVRRRRFQYLPGLTNYRAEPDEVRAVPVGEGSIDYASFFAALQSIGFSGFVTYELCSPLRGGGSMANLDRYASRFVDWMQQFPSA